MISQKAVRIMFYEPYPMGLGGNFLTQRLILERLDRKEFIPIVVAPIDGVVLDEFRKMDVECVVIPPPDNIKRYGGAVLREGAFGRIKAAFDLLRYNFKLAGFLRKRQIDVVYANCVRAEMSIGLAARLAGVPSLLYIKGELNNPVIDYLSFMFADRILYMCRNNLLLKYPKMIKKYESKISILEGGLEPDKLDSALNKSKFALKNELDIRPANFNVCVVGQICPLKGQHVVVKALSQLVSGFTNLRVYFIGDPVIDEYKPYMDNLKKIIEQYNLSVFVRFTGWRIDALEIMSCMDLLINPSFTEGFGYVPLEGMGVGLPVIATKVGVLPEAISDGVNGFLVEPGDVNAIAERWQELALNKELRDNIGAAAKKTVFSEYLIDDKVKQFAEICMKLVTDKN